MGHAPKYKASNRALPTSSGLWTIVVIPKVFGMMPFLAPRSNMYTSWKGPSRMERRQLGTPVLAATLRFRSFFMSVCFRSIWGCR